MIPSRPTLTAVPAGRAPTEWRSAGDEAGPAGPRCMPWTVHCLRALIAGAGLRPEGLLDGTRDARRLVRELHLLGTVEALAGLEPALLAPFARELERACRAGR